jgi:chaperonin GroES
VFFVLKPLGDRVVIEPISKEETTSGRVADNGERIALEVKEGDKVIFSKYAGTEVKVDNKEYLVLRESDILAIIG